MDFPCASIFLVFVLLLFETRINRTWYNYFRVVSLLDPLIT